jgi:hypothetical protein
MSFRSQIRRILPYILVLLLCTIALLIPPAVEAWKVIKTETPVVVSPPKASKDCASLHNPKKLRDISKKDIFDHIKKGVAIRKRLIKASALAAAIREADRSISRRKYLGALIITRSDILGDLELNGLRHGISIVMDSNTVIKGSVYIENSDVGRLWQLDTVMGSIASYQSNFGEFTAKCTRQFLSAYSKFSADVDIASVNDVTIEDSKFGGSLEVGTVLPNDGVNVNQFSLTSSSVSKATRLDICANMQRLYFDNSSFGGQMYVKTYACQPERRELSPRWAASESFIIIAESRFSGTVSFAGLQTFSLDLKQCTFSDLVDLSYANIGFSAHASDVDFEKELSLHEAQLPSKRLGTINRSDYRLPALQSGISIDRVRIGALRLRWDQLTDKEDWKRPGMNWYETKVRTQLDEPEWDQIEHALAEIESSTSTANEVKFRQHFFDALPHFSIYEYIQFLGWGFGYRPLWLATWIFGFFSLCVFIYWIRDNRLIGSPTSRTSWARLKFAILFGLRTAWHFPTFGPKNSKTTFLKITTWLEGVIMKVVFALWLNSLAHVSPLLNEIVKGIIPS